MPAPWPAARRWAAWSKRTSWAARLGVRPSWDRNRDHSRLRLQPSSAASSSTRTCPRLRTICAQAKATSGSTGRPASSRRASAASAIANRSSHERGVVEPLRDARRRRDPRGRRGRPPSRSSSGAAPPSTAWATTGDSRTCRHSTSRPRARRSPGAMPGDERCRAVRRPAASSTTSGSSPKSTTSVTAGIRDHAQVDGPGRDGAEPGHADARQPAGPRRDGDVPHRRASAHSAERTSPRYEPHARAERRDIRPRPGRAGRRR